MTWPSEARLDNQKEIRMIELNASFKSTEISVTQLKASAERNALAVQTNNQQKPSSSLLNDQQRQIVDEVGISDAAIQKFEDAQILADQLRGYVDYLNGNSNSESGFPISITANDNEPTTTIAGSSSKLSASVTAVSFKEETLDINAKFDDAGNLTELSIDKTSVTAEYIKADLILEERQFFAQA